MGKVDKLKYSEPSLPPGALSERQEDRRIKGKRLLVSFPVYATYNGSLIQGYIEAQNLSWSGMLLATNFPLNVGDHILLEFTLPNADVPIEVGARVVHRLPESVPEEATLIGVTFENMDTNVQRMISGFVLEKLPLD